MLDIIIANGTIVDGTGAPRYLADVGILQDRIAEIGDLRDVPTHQRIDAQGHVVAPGFVDVHNHSDGWLLKEANFVPKTLQGITTEILMGDGISYAPVDARTWPQWLYYMRALNGLRLEDYTGWQTLEEYMGLVHQRTAQNVLTHIPYANVRSLAAGFSRQPLDDFQLREICWQVEKGMDAGAVGLSTGLDYIAQCFANTDELVEVCRAMAPWNGIYASHVRYMKGTLNGVKEAVEIGRRAGVPVHITHMKATTAEDTDTLLHYVDTVARNEVDFTFDVYPYLPGCTMLNFMLPYTAFEAGPLGTLALLADPRLRRSFARSLAAYPLEHIHIAWLPGRENSPWMGKLLSEYVAATRLPAADALANLLVDENLAVLLVFHHGEDALVEPFLAHDAFMMGTDGIFFPKGAVHPRLYGSVARILGPGVRDRQLFTLEQAVRKLSGFPAQRFGLTGRGTVTRSAYADLVVFDAENIQDRATYSEPHQFSTGVEHVWVNGISVVSHGKPVEALPEPRPGRYLRYRR